MTFTEATTTTLDPRDANPRLAEGVELIGEYEGSGFKEPPSLIRRADGQVVQLPHLLYEIAALSDGARSYQQIASEVTQRIKRQLDAQQVHFLVEEKLRPLGVLAAADGTSPPVEKPDPFLALKFRAAVIPERVSNRLGSLFRPLFLPPIVLAVLAAFVAGDVWLFGYHGVAQALRQSIYHPGLFLPLFVGVVVSAAFHETGHAAACRYGGGHPGKMGCGLYLAWPAFYTDVTDAYRLGRGARLRTDLGGVYFNVIVVLATMGAFFATHFEPLLLLVLIQHLEIVHQLLPVIRLDGYYIVSDLTGVPDLFARIGPILRSLVPGTPSDERVTALKRWVRVAVTLWVGVVVPLLAFELLVILIHLPRLIGTAFDSAHSQLHHITTAHGDPVKILTSGLQLIVLFIPVLGILLMLSKSAHQLSRWTWRTTAGHPVRRVAAMAVALGGLWLLALAWIPKSNYHPITPHERGTVSEGIRAVRRLPSRRGPLSSYEHTQSPSTSTSTTLANSTSTTVDRATTTSVRDVTTTTFRESPTTTDHTPTTSDTTGTTTP